MGKVNRFRRSKFDSTVAEVLRKGLWEGGLDLLEGVNPRTSRLRRKTGSGYTVTTSPEETVWYKGEPVHDLEGGTRGIGVPKRVYGPCVVVPYNHLITILLLFQIVFISRKGQSFRKKCVTTVDSECLLSGKFHPSQSQPRK